jgi:hypothetical protein
MCEEKEVTVECTDCKKLLCENCSTKRKIIKSNSLKNYMFALFIQKKLITFVWIA